MLCCLTQAFERLRNLSKIDPNHFTTNPRLLSAPSESSRDPPNQRLLRKSTSHISRISVANSPFCSLYLIKPLPFSLVVGNRQYDFAAVACITSGDCVLGHINMKTVRYSHDIAKPQNTNDKSISNSTELTIMFLPFS